MENTKLSFQKLLIEYSKSKNPKFQNQDSKLAIFQFLGFVYKVGKKNKKDSRS